MRAVIQRVSEGSVSIDEKVKSRIDHGFVVLLGVGHEDSKEDADWLLNKILNLRVFADKDGKMNKSLSEVNGGLLVISQFTLFASTKKGNRPSFIGAGKPEQSKLLYEYFISEGEKKLGKEVGSGEFGAMMDISLINSGPVTINIDTKNKE